MSFLKAIRAIDMYSAVDAAAVTPSDSTDLTNGECRALYIGGTGAVSLDVGNSTAVVFAGVPAGTVLPVRAKRVRSTGTAATNIVALY
jgi:hypothetical protein